MAATFKWNMKGFADVRSLPAVTSRLAHEAQGRAERAGDGYETRGPELSGGRGRGRAAVIALPSSGEAKYHRLARG